LAPELAVELESEQEPGPRAVELELDAGFVELAGSAAETIEPVVGLIGSVAEPIAVTVVELALVVEAGEEVAWQAELRPAAGQVGLELALVAGRGQIVEPAPCPELGMAVELGLARVVGQGTNPGQPRVQAAASLLPPMTGRP
jgi:hypothetical protein